MNLYMYKKKRKFFLKLSLQILVYFLMLSQFSFTLLAQQQRRGVFLQDQVPGQEGGGSDTFFGAQEDDTGADGFDPLSGMGGTGTRGRSSASGGIGVGERLIYQVHVLGEVKRPGTYRVSPSMRVTDALQLAGNLKNGGSERFIELRKGGQAKGRIIDLFAYKILGQLSQNPYLADNETIYVPLKQRAVEIEGPVRRPGVFELKSERNLDDIVELAGGFTVGADPKNTIKVIRYGGGEERQIIEVSPNPRDMRDFQVLDGDVMVVPHKFLANNQFDYNLKKLPNDNIFYPSQENRVFVIGAVRMPGAFEFNQYYTVRQYLTVAGGTTTMAKNGKIKVVTVDGKSFKAKDGNYDRFVNPGDTIVVPEKSIPTAFYIGLLPTIASLGLSATALFK